VTLNFLADKLDLSEEARQQHFNAGFTASQMLGFNTFSGWAKA